MSIPAVTVEVRSRQFGAVLKSLNLVFVGLVARSEIHFDNPLARETPRHSVLLQSLQVLVVNQQSLVNSLRFNRVPSMTLQLGSVVLFHMVSVP